MSLSLHPKIAVVFLGGFLALSAQFLADDACCKNGACEKAAPEIPFGLTGDWGGFRSTLREHGYELSATYTSELFANLKGGQKRSAVFDGLLKLSLDVNLEKAAGLPGATFRLSGLYPHGTSGTLRNVGDASVYSNIDSYDSTRLVDFWVEQKLLEGKISLKVGQMRVDDEFGVTDSAAAFINSSFGVPTPPATPMPTGIDPTAALGIRLRFEPLEGLYGMAGIYDGNPSPGDLKDPSTGLTGNAARHGTDWALHKSEGTLTTGEIGYQRLTGSYPGAVRLGVLHHSDDFMDNAGGANHGSSTSTYYVLDQTLWQKSPDSKEGLSAFLRGTFAPKGSSIMDQSTQAGFVFTGLATTEDKVGLAYARSHFSPNQAGNPGREAISELFYQLPVTPYLRVQPDFQYISHPGGTTVNNNAWVVGIRAILEF